MLGKWCIISGVPTNSVALYEAISVLQQGYSVTGRENMKLLVTTFLMSKLDSVSSSLT